MRGPTRLPLQSSIKALSELNDWCNGCNPTLCVLLDFGWRQVVDRGATAGLQERTVGGRPVYVMPHTSGLNAHSRLSDLTTHFRNASELADRSSTKMPL
ncbi:MAG: hypothetical protein Ct9H300mP13_3480 [Gammaproteobacteria bacterium]|nr:MAG: hypothetical protein Ct9H300mP13_3480 [Gammaproteobacteria bacterium]